MIADHNDQTVAGPGSIAIRTDVLGMTTHMTKDAIDELAHRLLIISKAYPKDCYEVHLGMSFNQFDASDELIWPSMTFDTALDRSLRNCDGSFSRPSLRRRCRSGCRLQTV